MTGKRSFWQFSAAEARIHALMLAVVLWATGAGLLSLGTAYRDPFGQLKWTDFVNIYTMGHIAWNGPSSAMYDPDAEYRRQIAIVPASAAERYLPVYPPQISLITAPLSNLSYHAAAAIWALLSITVYGVTVWLAWRPLQAALPDPVLVLAAAAAFPPFWSLVMHGQTTAIPIVAFSAGAMALSRGRKVLAGALLGLLFIKPHFGLMLAVVVLICGEWWILAGLAVSAVVQAVLVSAVLGPGTWPDYLTEALRLAGLQDALAPNPEQMHSLASITSVLPGPIAFGLWLVACAWVAWITVGVWRSAAPLTVRMSALVLGSVLISPHVVVYDLAVLAVPLLWLGGWIESSTQESVSLRHQWRLAIYALFVLTLAPTASLVPLQVSPFIMMWFLHSTQRAGAHRSPSDGRLATPVQTSVVERPVSESPQASPP
jgi:alpha-1,2-mannosyltransferase